MLDLLTAVIEASHATLVVFGLVKSDMVLTLLAGIKRLQHSEMILYIGEISGDKLVALTRTGYMITM